MTISGRNGRFKFLEPFDLKKLTVSFGNSFIFYSSPNILISLKNYSICLPGVGHLLVGPGSE